MLVKRLDSRGRGVAGRRRILKAYPGDEVEAVRQGKQWHISRVISPGEHRVEPRCRHFTICNACVWQAMKYSSQLEFKKRRVEELFGTLEGVRPSPVRWRYRNKMELVFLGGKLGYRADGRWDRAFDIEECPLAMEWMPGAASAVRG